MNILDPLPDERILSLLLTLQCNASCLHCGTMSGPHVRSRIDPTAAATAIQEASASGFKLVVFTGGEPLMYGPSLHSLIELAKSLGLRTRIVTNAFWAVDGTRADSVVGKLTAAGLDEINFSTGDQHAKFVPLVRVLFAARAAMNHGLPVSLMIETVNDNDLNKGAIKNMPLFQELFDAREREAIYFVESPWMPLSPDLHEQYPEGFATTQDNLATRKGCDSIINTTTILADGRIMACCGLGTQTIEELHVGDLGLQSLAQVDQAMKDDFLKVWIKIEGPEHILAWAAEKDPTIEWEGQYAHRCQACKRIYSDPKVRDVLLNHHEEKVADVLFQQWLMHGFKQSDAGSQASGTSQTV